MDTDPAKPLKNQKALVVDATSAIGEAIARALAEAGAAVAVNYTADSYAADRIVATIRATGGEAVAVQGEPNDEAQVQAMFRQTVDAFGTLDILANNGTFQNGAPIEQMTLDQWNSVMGANLTSQFLCSREAIREFLRRGPRPEISCALGKIICMGSVREMIPWNGHANYAASKAGLMLFMKSMAQELAPKKIRVNSIGLGTIQTPGNQSAWETPEGLQALLRMVPYGRLGQPGDVARAAVWLASDASDYINGITLFVDGGTNIIPRLNNKW